MPFPIYLPDATLGVVRSIDARDLREAGIEALVMNVFHLMQKPGSSTIAALGGLHAMAAWQYPVVTDSGGFQAYSLIRQNPKLGRITDNGISFTPEGAERKFQLTPEKSVQLQLAYGSDIVIVLDDCTHVDASYPEQEAAVARTVRWAQRCKEEFVRQLAQRRNPSPQPPLLFGVVQGGGYPELRKRCAEALLEIGFDGYGYGGWPLDSNGNLLHEMLQCVRELIPEHYPLHALGVGHPESVVACVRMGYPMFDSALPTRDARNGRLYGTPTDLTHNRLQLQGDWFNYVYIHDKKYIKNDATIIAGCDCYTCQHYTLGYLHHLHKIGDTLFFRLATIHNLRFMARLMEQLRHG
jgi:queuine tRNA-ribosyltransferase